MISASTTCNAFLIACISQIFRALSYLQGHLGFICISCTQILLYKSWLLSQAQYVCGIHYCVVYLAHVYVGMYYIGQFRGLPDALLFVLCLGEHRYASPAAYSIGTYSSRRLVTLVCLASSGSSSFSTLVYLILISL